MQKDTKSLNNKKSIMSIVKHQYEQVLCINYRVCTMSRNVYLSTSQVLIIFLRIITIITFTSSRNETVNVTVSSRQDISLKYIYAS